jgi:hypothetical protein
MTTRQKTIVGLIAATFGIAAWDIYAASKGEENTISDVLHDAGKKSQFIPFLAGCICAHIFFGAEAK